MERGRDGRAFDLGRPPGHVAQRIHGEHQIAMARHGQDLAVVEHFQFGQQIGVALDQVGQAQQQAFALHRPQRAPGAGVERGARGRHRAVDIGRAAFGHLGDGRRSPDRSRCAVATGGRYVRAIDPQAVLVGEEGLRGGAGGLRAGPDGGGSSRRRGLRCPACRSCQGPFRGWCCRTAIVGARSRPRYPLCAGRVPIRQRKAHAS
jgi:hypothetical protein